VKHAHSAEAVTPAENAFARSGLNEWVGANGAAEGEEKAGGEKDGGARGAAKEESVRGGFDRHLDRDEVCQRWVNGAKWETT
jgi:hypothetical protein